MRQLEGNLWALDSPQSLLGIEFGRRVAIVRLTDGRLVVHSTAAFRAEDVAAIRALGEPGWILDATRVHDTFAREGRRAFPEIPYLVPPGFPKAAALGAIPLVPAPAEWGSELLVQEIAGMPWVREHAVFHPASRTLILADLLFDFRRSHSGVTRLVARHLMRLPKLMGVSRGFRMMIRDRAAFRRSLREILEWDFERIIPGHGEIIERDGRARLRSALQGAGLVDPDL